MVDTKTKMILHRYPLPRISFAADDKQVSCDNFFYKHKVQDRKVFSFIARAEADSNRHDCFIFLSDKMAEQITLTIGEAFDLAYKVCVKLLIATDLSALHGYKQDVS